MKILEILDVFQHVLIVLLAPYIGMIILYFGTELFDVELKNSIKIVFIGGILISLCLIGYVMHNMRQNDK